MVDLRTLIRDVPGFPKPGIVFKDIMPLVADPVAFRQAVGELAEFARPLEPDVILGAEARGFIFGAALAYELGVGFAAARKPGKLPYETIRAYSTSKVGLYGLYVRVLTPAASELIDAVGHDSDPIGEVESVGSEAARSVFANYLLVPPGNANMTYRWQTPAVAQVADGAWRYRLIIQKQPGMGPEPVTVRLTVPSGAVITSTPPDAKISGEHVTFSTTLTADLLLAVGYRLP